MFYPLVEFGSIPFVLTTLLVVGIELWMFASLDDKREGGSSSATAIVLAIIFMILNVVTVDHLPMLSWKHGVAYAGIGVAWMLAYWYAVLRYNARMLRKVSALERIDYGSSIWGEDGKVAYYLPYHPENHQLRAQALLWPIGIASFVIRNGTSGIITLFEGTFESIRQSFRYVPPVETRD